MFFVALVGAIKKKIALTRQAVFNNRNSRPKPIAPTNIGPMIGEMLERRALMSATIAPLDPAPSIAPLSTGGIFLQKRSGARLSSPSTSVSIPDPYLRAAVLRALGRSAGEITAA